MPKMDVADLLQRMGLRDTQPRRLVVRAFLTLRAPSSPASILASITRTGDAIHLTTVYRILAAFASRGLVHRHPCDGAYTLCSLPCTKGHHGFLHCRSCGRIEEFSHRFLCRLEDRIARSRGFVPSEHILEVLGTCSTCIR